MDKKKEIIIRVVFFNHWNYYCLTNFKIFLTEKENSGWDFLATSTGFPLLT